LGIILLSDLSWADKVNYTVKKAWKANSSTKSIAYMSLVRLILEYWAACWNPYKEGQINALDWVQKRAPKFAHHTNDSNWKTLAQRKHTQRMYALFKVYTGEKAWKATGNRLQRLHYLSRVDHDQKIINREAKDRYRKIFLCK
jgi:hypothetical protein